MSGVDKPDSPSSLTALPQGVAPGTVPEPQVQASSLGTVEGCVASIIGAAMAVLADMLSNKTSATTLKLGNILVDFFRVSAWCQGYIAMLIIFLLTWGVCWVRKPRDRAEAFAIGLAIFSFFVVVSPYQGAQTQLTGPASKLSPIGGTKQGTDLGRSVGRFALARTHLIILAQAQAPQNWTPNATVRAESIVVSSCKPSYSGFLGLNSFFNNTLDWCNSGLTLQAGDRVKILQTWTTNIRHYRYGEVEFIVGGVLHKGWAELGQGNGADAWLAILPDHPNQTFPVYGES